MIGIHSTNSARLSKPLVFGTRITIITILSFSLFLTAFDGSCGRTSPSVPSPIVSSTSSGTLAIPSSTATGIALSAASQYRVLSDQRWADYEDVVILSTINELFTLASNGNQAPPSSTFSDAASTLRVTMDKYAPTQAKFRYQDQATRLRYAIDIVCIYGSFPGTNESLLQAVFAIEKRKFGNLEIAFDPGRQSPADLASYALTGNALNFIADEVQEASDLASRNVQFASVTNPILKDLTGFDTSNSYAQIANSFTGLPSLPQPNADGSYTVTTQALITQYQNDVGKFQTGIDASISAFKAAKTGISAPSVLRAAFKPAREHASLDIAAAGDDSGGAGGSDISKCEACKTAQTDVTALGKLVGLSNSTLGSQISTVGSSAISAGNAISQLLSATTTGAMLGPVGALVSAGVGIFSSVFGGGNKADAAVLSQLNKISSQIASVQKDMDTQFATVDTTLTKIVGTLQQNFNQIDHTLGTLTGNVQSIQEALLDVETQLNQLASYNSYYHQAEEQDALMLSVNGCINYRANHNNLAIIPQAFEKCQTTFFTYSQTNASDGIWAPIPLAGDYADDQAFNTISNFHNQSYTPCSNGCPTPFAVLINFLAQYPSINLAQSPLSTAIPLANPDEWVLGARAYLEMSHEFPQYAFNRGATYLDQLITIGSNVEQAAENINSNRPAGGPLTSNQLLLAGPSGLTNKYSTAGANLNVAMQNDLNGYVSDPKNGIVRNNISLDLFAGGVNQHTAWRPALGTINICSGNSIGPAPDGVLANVPDLYAFSQGYLNSGQLSMCISLGQQWENLGPWQNGSQSIISNSGQVLPGTEDPDFPGDYDICSLIWRQGTLTGSINVSFNGTQVLSANISKTVIAAVAGTWKFPIDPMCKAPGGPLHQEYSPEDVLRANWTAGVNFQALFNSSSQVVKEAQPQILASVVSQLDSLASQHQKNIYSLIAKDIGNGGSAVQASSSTLDGARLLLQAFVNLGLPNSLAYNDSLHAALYGSNGLLDSAVVQSDFNGFGGANISDTTDNKVNDEIADLNARLSSLVATLNTVLGEVNQNQVPEDLSQVDITLEDLRAFESMQNAAVSLNNVGLLSPCDYHLSSNGVNIDSKGGTATLSVQVEAGCNWQATTGIPWLSITSGGRGSGAGSSTVKAQANKSGSARQATVVIGDQVFRVVQDAVFSPPK